jgi:hypothetical protein
VAGTLGIDCQAEQGDGRKDDCVHRLRLVILEIKAAKFGEVTRATPFDIVTPFDKVEGVYHQLARRLDRQHQRPMYEDTQGNFNGSALVVYFNREASGSSNPWLCRNRIHTADTLGVGDMRA